MAGFCKGGTHCHMAERDVGEAEQVVHGLSHEMSAEIVIMR